MNGRAPQEEGRGYGRDALLLEPTASWASAGARVAAVASSEVHLHSPYRMFAGQNRGEVRVQYLAFELISSVGF